MEEFTIKKAVFETSVGLGGTYPEGGVQIAMVGKSNVGNPASSIRCATTSSWRVSRQAREKRG